MLTKAEIVTYINNSTKLKSICRKLVRNDLADDLIQELSLIVLEYPQAKLDLVKSIDGFLIKILYNMTNKTYGTFSRKYLIDFIEYKDQQPETFDYDHNIDIDFEKAMKVIKKIEVESDDGYFLANLFRIYMREGSLRKVNKATDIPVKTVQWSINRFKEQVKKRI